MSWMPTPNFTLWESFSTTDNNGHTLFLPAGSFVRPISYGYVPQHILDLPRYRHFDKSYEVFCYTRFGMIAIPLKKLRES